MDGTGTVCDVMVFACACREVVECTRYVLFYNIQLQNVVQCRNINFLWTEINDINIRFYLWSFSAAKSKVHEVDKAEEKKR